MKLFKWESVQKNFVQNTLVQYILVVGQLGFCSITMGQLTGGNRRLATRRTTVNVPHTLLCLSWSQN